jgi:hypothetical protein
LRAAPTITFIKADAGMLVSFGSAASLRIPAQAGIQRIKNQRRIVWIPAFAGMTLLLDRSDFLTRRGGRR